MPGSSRECQNHSARKTQGSDPRQAYLEIVNAWQLGRRELAILRELAAWRQQEAVRRDPPSTSWSGAAPVQGGGAQANLAGISAELGLAPSRSRSGKRMLDIVTAAQQSDSEGWPEPIPPAGGLSPVQGRAQAHQGHGGGEGQGQQHPPELVASKKIIHQYFTWSWRMSAERPERTSPCCCKAGAMSWWATCWRSSGLWCL